LYVIANKTKYLFKKLLITCIWIPGNTKEKLGLNHMYLKI